MTKRDHGGDPGLAASHEGRPLVSELDNVESTSEMAPADRRFVLRLYVTGMTPRSTEALKTIKSVCEQHLKGCYDLEVIDIYQHPHLAADEQIVAVPMLVRKLPLPLRRLIGDLSDQEQVLLGLDLRIKS